MSQLGFEQFLTKNGSRTAATCYIGIITIAYTLSAFIFLCGTLQLWQSISYVEQMCQVKSNDVVSTSGGSYWRPSWKITLTDRTSGIELIMDGVITASNSYSSTWEALRVSRQKKIDQSFPCYQYRSYPLIGSWTWHWHEPTILTVFGYIFAFLVFFIIGTSLLKLRTSYQDEEQYGRKQRESKRSYGMLQSTSI
ncbi:hypothetical protein I4U23_015140 [Adineta vaga]|nr:hypothetical protein I4U23_015140 [Adineta vaga]